MPSESASVVVRFLNDPPVWRWCWDLVERGRILESSWDSAWTAYDSREEALSAGLGRLAELGLTLRGARRPAREATGRPPRVQIIIARDADNLYASFTRAFGADDRILVVRDRRFRERRRREAPRPEERRRAERRGRPEVDAALRAHGWARVEGTQLRALA